MSTGGTQPALRVLWELGRACVPALGEGKRKEKENERKKEKKKNTTKKTERAPVVRTRRLVVFARL